MSMTEQKWILYQTTNLVNGKIYIGVHKLADKFNSRNYLGSGSAMKTAIKKYGRESFVRSTLEEFSCSEDAFAAEAERVTVDFAKREDTYNMRSGGMGGIGCIRSEETRTKISNAHKGKVFSDEHKAKLSVVGKERNFTEETRAKMSASKKGTTATDETRAKMSAALKGRIFSEGTRAKMSVSSKGHKRCVGRVVSEDTKAKIGAANKGKTRSEEVKTKISKSLLGNQYRLGIPHSEETKAKSEEHKAKISAALKGKPKSEEHKAKMAAALNKKAVVINGTYYESETFAAQIEGTHRATLRDRLKNLKPEWSEWRYATEEEKEKCITRDAQSP